MTSYNKKCKGCGGFLSPDPQSPSYIPKFDESKAQYCYRCFRLKYYNETNYPEAAIKNVTTVFNTLNLENGHTFLIVDPFDIFESLAALPKDVKNVSVIVNKMDLFNNKTNWNRLCEMIIENIRSVDLDYQEIVFCSIKSKTSMKKLDDLLHAVGRKQKIYFIGKSNVGKSSLIKALLDLYKIETQVLCSPTINTTLGLNQISFPRYTIIDTPGAISDTNILNYIDAQQTSKIYGKETIKPRIYQIKYPKSIYLENLIQINLTPTAGSEMGTCVLFINAQIAVGTSKLQAEHHLIYTDKLSYKENSSPDFENTIFTPDNKINLCVSGLGLISVNHIEKIEIIHLKPIKITKLLYPIV